VMPNFFAWLSLALWPFVALAIYATRRSGARIARTTAWMMVLPVMFLPSSIALKTQGIPYLDKHRLSFLTIALALQLFHHDELLGKTRRHHLPKLVLLALFLGVIATVRTNGDAIAFGTTALPGLTSYDILSIGAALILDFYLPFAVGQRVYRTEQDLRDLLEVLSMCGLIYAPLCLVELRLSPQLHYWLYGYHPSEFAQAVREGGYRPVVFMSHGLSVAKFWFMCLCAAVALRRVPFKGGPIPAAMRATVACVFVLLCKSLAAIIYSAGSLFVQLALSSKAMSRVIAALVILVIAYPAARLSNVFPTDDVVRFFSEISPDRADSLHFRFRNEDALIARAKERPLFGWGTFGRSRIFDAESGEDLSVTDGFWIIQFGQYGYVGLAAFAALMLVPVLRFVGRRARMPNTSQALLGALAFMVLIFAIDLFPNTYSDSLPLAYAGALFTLSGSIRRSTVARKTSTAGELGISAIVRARA
jgi:hypothetical protein